MIIVDLLKIVQLLPKCQCLWAKCALHKSDQLAMLALYSHNWLKPNTMIATAMAMVIVIAIYSY